MKDKINYAVKKKEDYNIWRTLFYLWADYCVCVPYFNIFYDLKVSGKENMEKGKRYILAPNHISLLDPFVVASVVHKKVAYMAKKELFEDKSTCKWVHWLGAFSVNREKLEIATIRTVKEVFKTKWWLGIFPQGKIIKYVPIAHVNKGFAAIAKAAKTDILPMGISGCEEYSWKFKGKKLNVNIGKPISYELPLEEIMIQWAKQVGELSGYGYAPEEEIFVNKSLLAESKGE